MIVADPVATTVCYLSIGALGTGFLEASLRRGLDGPVDFIGADAGSTDELLRDFAHWHADVRLMMGAIEQPFKWALLGRPFYRGT